MMRAGGRPVSQTVPFQGPLGSAFRSLEDPAHVDREAFAELQPSK